MYLPSLEIWELERMWVMKRAFEAGLARSERWFGLMLMSQERLEMWCWTVKMWMCYLTDE